MGRRFGCGHGAGVRGPADERACLLRPGPGGPDRLAGPLSPAGRPGPPWARALFARGPRSRVKTHTGPTRPLPVAHTGPTRLAKA